MLDLKKFDLVFSYKGYHYYFRELVLRSSTGRYDDYVIGCHVIASSKSEPVKISTTGLAPLPIKDISTYVEMIIGGHTALPPPYVLGCIRKIIADTRCGWSKERLTMMLRMMLEPSEQIWMD